MSDIHIHSTFSLLLGIDLILKLNANSFKWDANPRDGATGSLYSFHFCLFLCSMMGLIDIGSAFKALLYLKSFLEVSETNI